jgi:hypothetical protein
METKSEITIRTNWHWHNVLYSHEIPQRILDQEFDWMENPEEEMFVYYRGSYYALSECMRISDSYWDGHFDDTAFSDIVIHLSDDGEQYQIALRFC